MPPPDARTRILEVANGEGFDLVRFAAAEPMLAARDAARARLADGHLDGMHWITDEWIDRSADPARFLAGARTVILLALPYHGGSLASVHGSGAPAGSRGCVARYARGRDYHRVFEKKLRRVARAIREEFHANARPTVDYGPLLERPLAAAAGMGWLGKSTMLLVPGFGPWVLLGAIATGLALAADEPLRKTCGACTRCIAVCPTGAISAEGNVLDARLCISYHTIENRGPVPRDLRARFGDWIFGCDACLDACPVGASNHATHPDFIPRSYDDAHPLLAPLLTLNEAAFAERFQGRPILRAKRDGFLRNVCVALGNVGVEADLPALAAALRDRAPIVRGHAAWAITRLSRRIASTAAAVAATAALEARLQIEQDAYVREELILALAGIQQPATGS